MTTTRASAPARVAGRRGAGRRGAVLRGAGPALWVTRRLIGAVIVLIAVSLGIFALVHAAPGSPESAIGGQFATPEQLASIRAEHHLDDPFLVQYGDFLASTVRLDFGESFSSREPVSAAIGRALAVSVPVLFSAWGFALIVGLLVGIATSYRRDTSWDRLALTLTTIGASTPVFATGMVLVAVFGLQLGWFPTVGSGEPGLDRVSHLALPSLTLAIVAVAAISRVVRVRVAEVLQEDHVVFDTARGVAGRRLLWRSVLRNSAVPVVAQAGAVLISLIGALVLVEEVFNLDGIGSLLLGAIEARDIPLIQAVTILISVFIIVVNLAVDMACLAIDPRISLGRKEPA